MTAAGYLVRRLLLVVPTLLGVLALTFLLLHTIPGDPALVLLGEQASATRLAELRRALGLDEPLVVQYLRYVGHLLRGDFGLSLLTRRPALDEVLAVLPASAALAASATGLAVLGGLVLGVVGATRRGSWAEAASTWGAVLVAGLPSFWVAQIALWLFSYRLGLLPAVGDGAERGLLGQLASLILPAGVLALSTAAPIMRLTTTVMLDVLGQEYVLAARARGLHERSVVWGHALRAALVPVVSATGVILGWSLGNALLVERVFARPGLGSLLVTAVVARDYPLAQACIVVIALVVVLLNTALDLLYGLIDPTIRRP